MELALVVIGFVKNSSYLHLFAWK